MSFNLKLHLLRQAIECVYILHTENNMAHLDLKPDNFVINDDFGLSLIDFCHSDRLNQLIKIETGTRAYQAPEIRWVKEGSHRSFVQFNYSAEKADIFSLGVCLFIIMFSHLPL